MKINPKIASKIIISCVIIFLISWLGFEITCNRMVSEDYQKVYNDLEHTQDTLYKLWNIHIDYIERERKAYDYESTLD